MRSPLPLPPVGRELGAQPQGACGESRRDRERGRALPRGREGGREGRGGGRTRRRDNTRRRPHKGRGRGEMNRCRSCPGH